MPAVSTGWCYLFNLFCKAESYLMGEFKRGPAGLASFSVLVGPRLHFKSSLHQFFSFCFLFPFCVVSQQPVHAFWCLWIQAGSCHKYQLCSAHIELLQTLSVIQRCSINYRTRRFLSCRHLQWHRMVVIINILLRNDWVYGVSSSFGVLRPPESPVTST